MFPRKLKAVHPMETVMKEMSRSENMEALKEEKEEEEDETRSSLIYRRMAIDEKKEQGYGGGA